MNPIIAQTIATERFVPSGAGLFCIVRDNRGSYWVECQRSACDSQRVGPFDDEGEALDMGAWMYS